MSIQGSINSMISSVGRALVMGKYLTGGNKQLGKAAEAKQSAASAVEAKQVQQRDFMSYLAKQETSLGGTVGQLPPEVQAKIAEQYSPEQRESLMNLMDQEAAAKK